MERKLIEKITQIVLNHLPDSTAMQVVKGIGDDCAELKPSPGANLIITTDTMLEGIHFRLDYYPPLFLGRKLAAVNLSDIAAMGGVPRAALLNIEVPKKLKKSDHPFWLEFATGLAQKLASFQVRLVGGDTVSSSSNYLGVTLTILGEVEPGKAIYRSGAKEGDLIYCSGPLGEAACGLYLLQDKKVSKLLALPAKRVLIARHLDPSPRIPLGNMLASLGISAMIDISDGIATDLAHIAQQSGLMAVIHYDSIPISRAVRTLAKALGKDPVVLALKGGEDFELLWTVPPSMAPRMERKAAHILGHRPFRIGTMEHGEGVWLKTKGQIKSITFKGYEH